MRKYYAGFGAAVLAAAACWTVRIAWSDWVFRGHDAESVRRAIRLAPENPDYYRGWAEVEPGRAVEALEKAALLDAGNSTIWMELSAAAEARGDYGKAEGCLLRAVDADRTYAPRLLLAEFYMRRGDARKFWPAARAALASSNGDDADLFRDCGAMGGNGAEMAKALPERADVRREYLEYLMAEKRIDEAAPVAAMVLAQAGEESAGALLGYCDALLGAGRGAEALAVWNGLSGRRLIPYAKLAPAAGRSVTNGGFEAVPLGAGFDWRTTAPDGVSVYREGTPAALRVGFSGNEPESCEILSQYTPLLAGREYVLTVRYGAAGIGAESGLYCRLLAGSGNDLLNGTGALPGGEALTERSFRLATLAGVSLARLVFGYRRALGTVRIEGSVTLRGFTLAPASGSGQ